MRTTLLAAALVLLAFPLGAQQQQEKQEKKETSVAEAARKAREKKKDTAKAGKVWTNDNLPQAGTVSVVGQAAPAGEAGGEKDEAKGEEVKDERGETYWRGKFADARRQLSQAERELDILQREFNLLQVQYYSDPAETMRQEFTREKVNEHRKKIEEKQKEIDQLKQGLAALEDELRREGRPAGWAREP